MPLETFVDDSPGEIAVRGYLHRPNEPSGTGVVLTHGAGSDCRAPLLVALAEAFCTSGVTVLRCDLPYRQQRPKGPPLGTAMKDQAGLQRAAAVLKKMCSGAIWMGGHSYGGRQASMLAAAEPGVADALLLLSYPLHPPKQPSALRVQHFPGLKIPTFFVHGVRDGFATPEELENAIKAIPAPHRVLSVEGAGHELMNSRNRSSLPELIATSFESFVQGSDERKKSTAG